MNRLFRSSTDRVLAGVCGGMAESYGWDPALVRIVWVILDLLTGILPMLVLYVIIAIVVPEGEPVGPNWGPPWTGTWGPGAPTTGGTPATGENADPAQPGATQGAAPGAAPGGAYGWSGWGSAPPPSRAEWRAQRHAWRAQWRADRAAWHAERRTYDPGWGTLIVGGILVLVGAGFLLRQVVPGFDTDLVWPIVIILVGAVLLAGSFRPWNRGGDNK